MANSDWSRQRNSELNSGIERWEAIDANPIMDRLDRWADTLPVTEPIPVGQDEIYELVSLMVGKACRYTITGKPIRALSELEILESLRSGNFHYREHKLVVI